jgi:hypothetical protein
MSTETHILLTVLLRRLGGMADPPVEAMKASIMPEAADRIQNEPTETKEICRALQMLELRARGDSHLARVRCRKQDPR